jgi:hypothetical protein
MTGIGAVRVRCPRVRDRVGEGGERIRFSSAILPPYARRSKSLEVLLPTALQVSAEGRIAAHTAARLTQVLLALDTAG